MEVSSNVEENLSIVLNLSEIPEDLCRICLKKCSDNEQWQLFRNGEDIARKIMAFAAVEIKEGDGLPALVCCPCRELIDTSYNFKNQVETSDKELRRILTPPSLKSGSIGLSKSIDVVITEAIRDELHRKEDGVDIRNPENMGKSTLEESMDKLTQESIDHQNDIFDITKATILQDEQETEPIEVQDFEESMSRKLNEYSESYEEVKDIKEEILPYPEATVTCDKASIFEESSKIQGIKMEMGVQNHCNNLGSAEIRKTVVEEEEDEEEEEEDQDQDEDEEEEEDEDEEEEEEEEDNDNDNDNEVDNRNDFEVEDDNNGRNNFQDIRVKSLSSREPEDEEEKPLISRTRRHSCEHCIKTFASKLALQRHSEVHKGKTKLLYVCHVCDKQFSTITKLKNHVLVGHSSFGSTEGSTEEPKLPGHPESNTSPSESPSKGSSDKRFNCKFCGRRFTYQKSFFSHAKTHPEYKGAFLNGSPESLGAPGEEIRRNSEDPLKRTENSEDEDPSQLLDDESMNRFQCTQCGKLFGTKRNLKRHVTTHSGLKFTCSTCGKGFSRVDKLKEHEQSKHKEEIFSNSEDEDEDTEDRPGDGSEQSRKKEKKSRPHKCAQCTKAFAQAQSLANHMERHKRVKDTQKRFLCEVCSKCFAQSGSLVAHMRTHTGVKPYVCNVCSRAFTKSTYLQLHLRTHSGEKPYICQYCSRAFARANTLARHITMHTGEAKYHCQVCMKSFRRLTSLNEHTYTHTGQRPYACKICTKRYNNAGSLYAHTKKCKAQHLTANIALAAATAAAATATTTVVVPAGASATTTTTTTRTTANVNANANAIATATAPTNFAVSVDATTGVCQNGVTSAPASASGGIPQMVIYSQRKLVEDATVGQIQPTPQFMVANLHNQKQPTSTNVAVAASNVVLQSFPGVEESNVYAINAKQYKTPYYTIYPNM